MIRHHQQYEQTENYIQLMVVGQCDVVIKNKRAFEKRGGRRGKRRKTFSRRYGANRFISNDRVNNNNKKKKNNNNNDWMRIQWVVDNMPS